MIHICQLVDKVFPANLNIRPTVAFINQSYKLKALKEFEKVKERVNQAKSKSLWAEMLKSDECYAEWLNLPKEHMEKRFDIEAKIRDSLSGFTNVEREFDKALIHAPKILTITLESISQNYFQAHSELCSWANEGVRILKNNNHTE